jgi:hypothetical protein
MLQGRNVSHLRCSELMIVTVPSPSGLGYVLARLWRSGFAAIDFCMWVVARHSAPEARKTVAQRGSAG